METKSNLLKMMTEGISKETDFMGETYKFLSPKNSDFMKLYSEDEKGRQNGAIDMVIDCTRDINNGKIFTGKDRQSLLDDRSGFVDFAIEQIIELRKGTVGETLEDTKKN